MARGRVPHFSGLTVAAGSTLTAAAWDGTRGGLLALRVNGTATILGDVAMDAGGFRGGPDAVCGLRARNRLVRRVFLLSIPSGL